MLKKTKEKFKQYGLMERVEQRSFKQFFTTPELQFLGSIFHQLLLRKIKSMKNDKPQFLIGSIS